MRDCAIIRFVELKISCSILYYNISRWAIVKWDFWIVFVFN